MYGLSSLGHGPMPHSHPDNEPTQGDQPPQPPPPISTPQPSARVRLEAELLTTQLAADRPINAGEAAVENAGRVRTVLLVAADAELRHYVRECVHDVPQVRLIEASSPVDALEMTRRTMPNALIVDRSAASLLTSLADVRAIVITDEPGGITLRRGARLVLLSEPFRRESLALEVERLVDT